MHYSGHRLTTLVAYVPTWLRSRTRQPMTNGLAMPAHWLVRQKLNSMSSVQFSSITSLCMRLYCFWPLTNTLVLDLQQHCLLRWPFWNILINFRWSCRRSMNTFADLPCIWFIINPSPSVPTFCCKILGKEGRQRQARNLRIRVVREWKYQNTQRTECTCATVDTLP